MSFKIKTLDTPCNQMMMWKKSTLPNKFNERLTKFSCPNLDEWNEVNLNNLDISIGSLIHNTYKYVNFRHLY